MIIIVKKRAGEFAGRVRKRFRGRAIEWEHAIVLTLLGVVMLANPEVFEGPAFVAFIGGAQIWGPVLLGVGLARILALLINGYMARPTAMVRAMAAVSGIMIFAAMSLGFLFSWTWPTGLAVYPVLGFFGLFPLGWAILDVAIPDDHDNDA